MDECMDILRGLTTGEFFGYDGEFYEIEPLKQCPAPTEKIPLLVGGHVDAALRRAVRKGDGWMHAGGDGEELDRLLIRLAEIRKEEGDTRDDFEVHVISYDAYDLDGIKRLEDKGVTDCIVGFRVPYIKGPDTEPLETKIKHLEQYAENDHPQGQDRGEREPRPTKPPPGRDRRGRGADRERAVHPDRAGPARGLRLPVRPDPDGDADGLRLRPRPAAVRQPHPPVLPAGARQPRRALLQRLPARGRRVRRPRPPRHHRRPVVPGDGRHLQRRLRGHQPDGLRRPRARRYARTGPSSSPTSPSRAPRR